MLTDPPGHDAYPIAATVFVLMSKSAPWGRTRNTLNFIELRARQGRERRRRARLCAAAGVAGDSR